jgi:hypothetical protein
MREQMSFEGTVDDGEYPKKNKGRNSSELINFCIIFAERSYVQRDGSKSDSNTAIQASGTELPALESGFLF